ncbi:MAG: class I SAM-dependent methyltransferase [Acidimicrobiales bacterium]
MVETEHHNQHHGHHHGPVRLDEAEWKAMVGQAELEGDVLLAFVTDTAQRITALRGGDAPPVRRIIDIGSGPGVGTCEFARLFPDAQVVAVDGSPAMLERATQRATERGLSPRVSTHLAELPGGLEGIARADVIWASMSLHHVGDEVAALRVLRDLLDPHGLLAIAELAEPMRMLPEDLGLGRPGLAGRLDDAGGRWFAQMRDGLTHPVASTDLASMVTSAGFELVDERLDRLHLDDPLWHDARRMLSEHLRRTRQQLEHYLDEDDLHALTVLSADDGPDSVMHRRDVFVDASRQIIIARPG